MKYQLLKEFLECDLSQKDFAEARGVPFRKMNAELWKQMMSLFKCGLVIPKMYQIEMRYLRKYKEEFLTAINNIQKQ